MSSATGGMNLIGVNIAGGEFGSNVPGVLGTDYIYPSTQEIDYYASQGMTVIRVPFLIERLENSPGGPLSQQDLQQLQSIVAYAATKGVDVILDPHNYGDAWGQEILPGNTTEQEYDKFMSQFAASFKSDPNVIFGLMNQPNQQTPAQQAQIDSDVIAAIRGAGATQELLIPGTDWDGGWTWVSSGNAAAINPSTIVDPDHNYAIEVHQYLDSDGSGTNFSPITDPNIGSERLTAVTQWAEQNGVKLFLGETGVPSDSQSLTALQNELSYMEQNSSAWQGVAYWAGGAWWGSYPMSIEPTGLGTGTVTNAPQMNVLKQFAPGGSLATGYMPPGGSGSGSTFTPSPNATVITPGSGSITDASDNVWTVTSAGTVDMNGAPAGYSANVIELAYVNGNLWQENSSDLWWEWTGSGWSPGAGTSTSPLPSNGGGTGTTGGGSGSGQILWGSGGHEDQGAPYTTVSLGQQASDLHTVFGSGTVLYRDFGDSLSPSASQADIKTVQAQGIQPIVVVDTYPNWGSYANTQAAYNWGFSNAQAMAQGSTAQYFEIGNEWSGDPTHFPHTGNGLDPSGWTSGPNFQDAVAVTAGAIAAIRQYDPSAKIIGGAANGWVDEGFQVALAQALQSEYPQVGMWDYTSLHWYSNMGDNPANFNGGMNAIAALKPIGKPIAITEFGANDGGNGGSDLTAMMQNFKANAAVSSTSPGIALATQYELYPNGGWQDALYNVSGTTTTLSSDGQAVQSEINALGGNGSGGSPGSGSTYPSITNGSGPDSIVLQMSENAWANGDHISDANGEAEFTVSVNGVRQGGTFTALAPHSAGADETFNFSGTFGAKPTLQVTFINDAYGGTPQTDRNLYVDSISYDGVSQNQSEALYSNGTATFALDPPAAATKTQITSSS